MILFELERLTLSSYLDAFKNYRQAGKHADMKLLHGVFEEGTVGIIYKETGVSVLRSRFRLGDEMMVLHAGNAGWERRSTQRHQYGFVKIIAGDGFPAMDSQGILSTSKSGSMIVAYNDNGSPTTITYPPHYASDDLFIEATEAWLLEHIPDVAGEIKPSLSTQMIFDIPASLVTLIETLKQHFDFDVMSLPMLQHNALVDLLRCAYQVFRAQVKPDAASAQDNLFWQMDRLIQHVLFNINKPLPSLSEMGILTGVNVHTLRSGFKRRYGQTIGDYFTMRQMEWAETALQNEGASVKQIGYSIGYRNLSHFAAAFKKYRGFLPSEIRKKF